MGKVPKNFNPVIAGAAAFGVLAGLAVVLFFGDQTAPVTVRLVADAVSAREKATENFTGKQDLADALEANSAALLILQEEVRELRDMVAAVDLRMKAKGNWPPPLLDSPDEIGGSTVSDDMDLDATMEEAQAQVWAHFDEIEAEFSSEPIDRRWSDAIGAQIEDALATVEVLAGARLDYLECRARGCRLEIEFNDDENLDAAQAHLAFAVAEEAPRMALIYEEDPAVEGRKKAIIYFMREGYSLLDE